MTSPTSGAPRVVREPRGRVDAITVVAVAVTIVVAAGFGSMLIRQRPVEAYYWMFLFHNGPTAVVMAWMGRLVLRRDPGHGAGRAMVAIAVLSAVHVIFAVVADVEVMAIGVDILDPTVADQLILADMPLTASIPVFVISWLWVLPVTLIIVVLPLLFPDGTIPSERWRWVLVVAAVGATAAVIGTGADAWPTNEHDVPAFAGPLIGVGILTVGVAALAAFVALALRWRTTELERRGPFRIVGVTAGILALVVVATYPWWNLWVLVTLVGVVVLLAVYGLAVSRYGLHDIEPFLGRAAVATTLSLLAAALYGGVVVGIGRLASHPFDNAVLPAVAVGLAVLLANPAQRRVRREVDKWLFRADTDRTEVMSRVAAHANTSATTADLLAEVTGLLVRSTGAERVEAWLDAEPDRPAASAGVSNDNDAVTAATLVVAVTDHGDRFGELRLYARVPTDLVADSPQLVADVAHALGVALRNDQLTAQLSEQLDELRASRNRLVEAHDAGRRSLERDIHDGAQSRLIALRLRLGVARVLAGDRDPRLTHELDELGVEIDAAVRSLRDLARGLSPPLLEESGVAAALQAHGHSLPIPMRVTADSTRRYRPAVESAAYFCCLEATQNAVRHSGASTITVKIDGDDTSLRFLVRDDGCGFDPGRVRAGAGLANIDDRISALGGRTEIRSVRHQGTCVSGEIPAQPLSETVPVADR